MAGARSMLNSRTRLPLAKGSQFGDSNHLENVTSRNMRLLRWVQSMQCKGILPRTGFYKLSYKDGQKLVLPVMQALKWNCIEDYTKEKDHPVFFWCNCRSVREIVEWREEFDCSNLVFCNCLTNVMCLHNKKALLKIIRNYEKLVLDSIGDPKAPNHLRFPGDIQKFNSDSYLPLTLFDLNHTELEYIAKHFFTDTSVWIAKPLTQNCGKGIVLIRDRQTLLEQADRLPRIIIQKYISNSLTLDNRKCDLRVYLLLVCPTKGRILSFYHPGFVRLALDAYDADSCKLSAHLTNQSVAKRTEQWSTRCNDSTWSPSQMNAYINRHKSRYHLPNNYVFDHVYPTIKSILGVASRAAYSRICKVDSSFEILGCDFLLDTDGKVWLIEINCYPGMATSTALLQAMKPSVMQESICLAIECLAKGQKGMELYPLESLKFFQLLWDSDRAS